MENLKHISYILFYKKKRREIRKISTKSSRNLLLIRDFGENKVKKYFVFSKNKNGSDSEISFYEVMENFMTNCIIK